MYANEPNDYRASSATFRARKRRKLKSKKTIHIHEMSKVFQ